MFDRVLNTPLATKHKNPYCIFALLKFCMVFDFRRPQSPDRVFTFHTFFSLIKNCSMLNICALRKTHEALFTLFFTNATVPLSSGDECKRNVCLINVMVSFVPWGCQINATWIKLISCQRWNQLLILEFTGQPIFSIWTGCKLQSFLLGCQKQIGKFQSSQV